MASFARRVKTASGATAVQIVHKRGRVVLGIDHVGSAHDEAQLAALLEVARVRLHAGQLVLPLDPATRGFGSIPAETDRYGPVLRGILPSRR